MTDSLPVPAGPHPDSAAGASCTGQAPDLARALTSPAAWPLVDPGTPVDHVEHLETHVSHLFFVGHRVYKVKKAVDLGFLDQSTLERRQHACHEEVRLNERLAPGVYLGVVPITREADGSLKARGEGEIVEVAVAMHRLPADRLLDHMLDAGQIDNARVHELADLLAVFHQFARTGMDVDQYGTPEAVRAVVLGNLQQLTPFVGDDEQPAPAGVNALTPALHDFLVERTTDFLDRHTTLLQKRVDTGRIREGHGDLHAGNICCTETGLVAYDCIEFSRALRCGDVANDLAFLAMDLDSRGFRAFSRQLVRDYLDLSRDRDAGYLIGFYKTYRALVRAKVAALTASQKRQDDPEREVERRKAMRNAQLAVSYQLPAAAVLMCGLPASGKSWLGRALAQPFEARVLRSDVIRKQLAGLPPTTHPEGQVARQLYSEDNSRQLYRHLSERMIQALTRGRSVVVDAMFAQRAWRRRFVDIATRLRHPVVVVHVTCDEAEVQARMQARAVDDREVSDADLTVYTAAAERFETPDDLPRGLVIEHRSGDDEDRCRERLLAALIEQCRPPRPTALPAQENPA